MQIGSYILPNNLILAPMAGVTDRPFRNLCRRLGAGMAVSEMIHSNALLWKCDKTKRKMDHEGENEPRSVQIAGAKPEMMADAARMNVDNGAQIIDINMGCPAKKVCNASSGSALLKDEELVQKILSAIVKAVNVPVTLKIRTGWNPSHRNGVQIAKIAEQEGIQALAVHGRTRACAYRGDAEYDTITAIKQAVNIPIIANGDIKTPDKALFVLKKTKADALMIGRAAQGNPWIFREIQHFLNTGQYLSRPSVQEIYQVLSEHLDNLYEFYGEYTGVRMARKHLAWYTKSQPNGATFRREINKADKIILQKQLIEDFFTSLQV